VERQGCPLILADTWPEKIGKGLMFISMNVEQETREAAIAALDALRAELDAKGVPVKDGSWGYRLLVVDDPDGNQLFFNYPNETASGGQESFVLGHSVSARRSYYRSPESRRIGIRRGDPSACGGYIRERSSKGGKLDCAAERGRGRYSTVVTTRSTPKLARSFLKAARLNRIRSPRQLLINAVTGQVAPLACNHF
jgi:hypothetical protein